MCVSCTANTSSHIGVPQAHTHTHTQRQAASHTNTHPRPPARPNTHNKLTHTFSPMRMTREFSLSSMGSSCGIGLGSWRGRFSVFAHCTAFEDLCLSVRYHACASTYSRTCRSKGKQVESVKVCVLGAPVPLVAQTTDSKCGQVRWRTRTPQHTRRRDASSQITRT